MKVAVINGSANKNGNTALALSTAAEVLEEHGIETQRIDIGTGALHGCIGCGVCWERQNRTCVFGDDKANEWMNIMFDADGLLIGTPVYYAGMNGALKSFLDRAFFVSGANGNLFRHKVGAAVAAVRRAGSTPSLDQIHKYFTISEMIIPGSCYWNMAYGMAPGEAKDDAEGMNVMRVLGRNMAWLMQALAAGSKQVPPPPQQEIVRMNFIR